MTKLPCRFPGGCSETFVSPAGRGGHEWCAHRYSHKRATAGNGDEKTPPRRPKVSDRYLNAQGLYQCDTCPQTFTEVSKLRGHFRSHTLRGERKPSASTLKRRHLVAHRKNGANGTAHAKLGRRARLRLTPLPIPVADPSNELKELRLLAQAIERYPFCPCCGEHLQSYLEMQVARLQMSQLQQKATEVDA